MESFELMSMVEMLSTNWKDVLRPIAHNHASRIDASITEDIERFSDTLSILPPKDLVLNAFNHFNVEDLKVVIIGQDVYPTEGDGMGLCFSAPEGTRCPPSLRNIFKELENEYGVRRHNTDLSDWAKQGVLMINTALTVRESCPGSHIKVWKDFTKDLISYIAKNRKHVVYLLWGEHAIGYSQYIDTEHNTILTHSHPSPLSRKPFTGCGHFRKCNEVLEHYGKASINWI